MDHDVVPDEVWNNDRRFDTFAVVEGRQRLTGLRDRIELMT